MKEDNLITARQFISLTAAFFLGNALAVTGGISRNEKIGYITLATAFLFYIFLCLIYERIFSKCGTSDIFEITDFVFGKISGKIFYAVIFLYSLLTALISSVEFLFFVETSSDFSIKPIWIALFFSVCIFCILLCGKKALARYAELILPFVLGIIAVILIFGINKMDFSNLIPEKIPEAGAVMKESAMNFLSPFSNILIIYFFVSDMFTKKLIKKSSIKAGLTALAVLAAVYIANLAVIGKNLMNSLYFPTLYTFSVINPELFTERSETIFFTTYIFLDILYTSCAYFTAINLWDRIFSKKNTPPKKIRKVFLLIPPILSFIVMKLAPGIDKFRSSFGYIPFIFAVVTVGAPILLFTASYFKKNHTNPPSRKEK